MGYLIKNRKIFVLSYWAVFKYSIPSSDNSTGTIESQTDTIKIQLQINVYNCQYKISTDKHNSVQNHPQSGQYYFCTDTTHWHTIKYNTYIAIQYKSTNILMFFGRCPLLVSGKEQLTSMPPAILSLQLRNANYCIITILSVN